MKSNDIAAGDLVPVEVDGLALLVAADLDGKIFAIANSCPHLGTPLENGRLGEGSTIVCPLHKSAFSLVDGMSSCISQCMLYIENTSIVTYPFSS